MGLNRIIRWLIAHNWVSFRTISLTRYLLKFKRMPNLKEPKDINEKLLWLEFNTDTTRWTELSDKHLVRRYVEEKGLSDILVRQYGHYYDANDIDFSILPTSFVIKTNNGYGTVLLIKDKTTINEHTLKEKLNDWLKEPFGYTTGEPHYTHIRPCIVIEEMLTNDNNTSTSLVDYKLWCINGKVYSCFLCTNRDIEGHKAHFCKYTVPDWTRHEEAMSPAFRQHENVPCPLRLNDMIRYAEILSMDFPLVRVDFYEVEGKVYFGEMTFTSNGGRMSYYTKEELLRMGEALDLSACKVTSHKRGMENANR